MGHSYDRPISTRLLLSAVFAVAFFYWISYQSHTGGDHGHAHSHAEETLHEPESHEVSHGDMDTFDEEVHDHDHEHGEGEDHHDSAH